MKSPWACRAASALGLVLSIGSVIVALMIERSGKKSLTIVVLE